MIKEMDPVKFVPSAPRNYDAVKGKVGEVKSLTDKNGIKFATIEFPMGGGAVPLTVKDVLVSRLMPVKPPPGPQGRTKRDPDELLDTRDEAARLAEGARELERLGYGVLRVGQGRMAAICHKCSRDQKKMVRIICITCKSEGFSPSTDSTPGTPDTLVYHDEWPVGQFLGMEWKDAPKGTRTDEQKALEAKGRIVVAWNLYSCFAAVYRFEKEMGRSSPVALVAYLQSDKKGLPE